FSVSTGDTGATFRWERSRDGSTWTEVSGATSRTYTFTAASGDNGLRLRAIVSAAAGGSTTSNAATLTIGALNRASVTSGRVGATVALVGRGLSAATRVTFGGVAAPRIVVASATTVWVSVPAGARTGPLVVTIGGGTLRLSRFTILAGRVAPTVGSFSPASAAAGATVTVTGTNLIGTTAVRIGTVRAAFRVLSPTKLTLTVPSTAATGRITIVTAGGTATSRTNLTRIR
ncbi:MAG: hypothetical protein RL338_1306, partial [Chloroflexota bacterium]